LSVLAPPVFVIEHVIAFVLSGPLIIVQFWKQLIIGCNSTSAAGGVISGKVILGHTRVGHAGIVGNEGIVGHDGIVGHVIAGIVILGHVRTGAVILGHVKVGHVGIV
jgi:hypothetical protein